MTIWQNYISAYRSMLPMKIEGLWAGWEGKGTHLNAITHSHPHFLKSRQVDISDGKNVTHLASACDYKRIYDGNNGPNTGGMGSYSPAPWTNPTQEAAIKLFESKGYKKWGVNPFYALVNGKNVKGYYYYKKIK